MSLLNDTTAETDRQRCFHYFFGTLGATQKADRICDLHPYKRDVAHVPSPGLLVMKGRGGRCVITRNEDFEGFYGFT